MSRIKSSTLFVLIACIYLGACSGETKTPLLAANIEIIEPMPGKTMSAGYLTLINNTDVAITISNVASPEFESVEIHESILEDGVAKMRRIAELLIPADSKLTLERGGKHLMLMRPTGAAKQVTLNFYSGDTILLGVQAPLTSRNN
jgi:copper(I)-binding protein